MSQCFTWVNFEKKELLGGYWDCGGKLFESAWTGCKQNNALLTLLNDRWAGDHLLWCGCEGFDFRESDTPFKAYLNEIGCSVDECYDYRDIAGLFPESKGEVRERVFVESIGDFQDVLYEGPFNTDIRWFRFIINHDKHQYIDRERTAVCCVAQGEVWRDDLFPALCAPYDWNPDMGYYIGMWFGDLLEASNQHPPSDYEDLSHLKSETSVSTSFTNEEILAYVNEGAPPLTTEDSIHYYESEWYKFANRRLDELIGVDRSGEII